MVQFTQQAGLMPEAFVTSQRTCVLAKRYSRGCQESSSNMVCLGSLFVIASGNAFPKDLVEYFYNDTGFQTV